MSQEGQEDDEDLLDDLSESFVLCALHQAKVLCERWKFWSGSVPVDAIVRLHRLESLLSINKQSRQRSSVSTNNIQSIKISLKNDVLLNTSSAPLEHLPRMNLSQPFLADIVGHSSIDKYLTGGVESKHNIVIQGPDIRRIVAQKRGLHFWCCH